MGDGAGKGSSQMLTGTRAVGDIDVTAPGREEGHRRVRDEQHPAHLPRPMVMLRRRRALPSKQRQVRRPIDVGPVIRAHPNLGSHVLWEADGEATPEKGWRAESMGVMFPVRSAGGR
jgi:hypothetical protein